MPSTKTLRRTALAQKVPCWAAEARQQGAGCWKPALRSRVVLALLSCHAGCSLSLSEARSWCPAQQHDTAYARPVSGDKPAAS